MSSFKKKSRKIIDVLGYGGFLLAAKFLLILPDNSARKLGRFFSWLAYHVDIRHRRLAVYNLTLAFGGEKSISELRLMAREVFRNLGTLFVDFIRAPNLKNQDVDDNFEFVGMENFDEGVKSGKGFIVVSSHLGNWELLVGHTLKRGNGSESIVAKRIGNPYIDAYVCRQREALGVKVIPTRRMAGEILKRLKNKGVLVFIADQRAQRQEGIFVRFFGIPALTNIAPALMALKTGALVVPMFVIRLDNGKHRIEYKKPLPIQRTDDRKQDIAANTIMITQSIEAMIRKYPEQWFWVHSRWRTIPEPHETIW